MMQKRTLLIICFTFLIHALAIGQSNNATLTGIVTDANGQPLELVNVALRNYPIGTTTNRRGEYLLRIPARRDVIVVFSSIGYKTVEKSVNAGIEERISLSVEMESSSLEIGEIQVTEQRRNIGGLVRIDPTLAGNLPTAGSGAVEAMIKTLPGVSSNNELSSQYSVRGGNFDENLVYVNDIEIYRDRKSVV